MFKNLLRLFLTACIVALSLPATEAQIAIKQSAIEPIMPDSIDVAEGAKKHFWRASGEVFGFNMGLWAFDRYVQKGDFAYISFKSIKKNFEVGFKWDNDKLGTNTFLHPYTGNLYFNAARSNGYSFWGSELFAIGGSAMWELFMEREYPSTNDVIATPIGGAAIGEMLFRASDACLDDRTTGHERFERELACFIISPMRGLNRIFTGAAWRHSATPGRLFGTPNIGIRLSAGYKMMAFQGRMRHMGYGGCVQIDLEYGDRFEVKSTKPYDYFTVRGELQVLKGQPMLNQLSIQGRLLAREFLEEHKSWASIGLYQDFNFYDSDTIKSLKKVPFKLGIPASVGVGLMFRDRPDRRYLFDAFLHVNGILLGSVLSDHYHADERNYNWASGFAIKAGINLVSGKYWALSASNEYYRLFSWAGYRYGVDPATSDYRLLNVQGDHSTAFFNVTDIRLDVQIHKHLYAAAEFTNYVRSTHYRDFPHVLSSTMALRIMAAYKF